VIKLNIFQCILLYLIDLLSIPTKQFLQILSQVQDLHRTAQSFESTDRESLVKLYDYAQKCKLFGVCINRNRNNLYMKIFFLKSRVDKMKILIRLF
jgi:hypothetical protein